MSYVERERKNLEKKSNVKRERESEREREREKAAPQALFAL